MEQYWMPKSSDRRNLRVCIDNYLIDRLFIRQIGSMGGEVKVNEILRECKLDFKMRKSGLSLSIDSTAVFCFPLKSYHKGFSLAYERICSTDDGIGRMVMLSHGVDPYDPELPEPQRSFLRIVLDEHLMEIFFHGRVHLKFHSWWEKPHWKYWAVDLPRQIQGEVTVQKT